MTGQINDSLYYKGTLYSISGVEYQDQFFDINKLGLNPAELHTACWRGYIATFAINDDGLLVLRDLETNNGIGLFREGPIPTMIPTINGKLPQESKPSDLIDAYKDYRVLNYEAVDLPMDYSGGVLITDGFIRERYIHLGFQSPMSYELVFELVFENGKFIKENDLSELVKELRSQTDENENWIDEKYPPLEW